MVVTSALRLPERRAQFEATKQIYESAKLTFHGVDAYDVYNASIPFDWQGRSYIFGRVERRAEWARSWVRLFAQSGPDEWTLVPDSMIYPLEDPYIARIHDQLVLGGTHVRYKSGVVDTYYGYFYRGSHLDDLVYFTTGPDYMKDIRLVELADGRIGVFSRPRNDEILCRFGCESQIGYATIDRLEDLTAEVIEHAPYIPGLFGDGEWGGCNQAYALASGVIGVIGHYELQRHAGLGREDAGLSEYRLRLRPGAFRNPRPAHHRHALVLPGRPAQTPEPGRLRLHRRHRAAPGRQGRSLQRHRRYRSGPHRNR